jgi:hypothetical protein
MVAKKASVGFAGAVTAWMKNGWNTLPLVVIPMESPTNSPRATGAW